jgi:hypothetical protein
MPRAVPSLHVSPRTPLVRPREYFEGRGFDTRRATAAVAVATFAVIAAFVGFAAVLSDRLAAAGHGDAASAVWDVFLGHVSGIVIAMVVGWLLVAVLVHFLARAFVSHDGRFEQTVVVVGWGMVPSTVTSVVAFAFLVAALGDASMTTPQAFVDQFRAELARTSFVRNIVAFLVAGWQTYLYAKGLSVAFDDRSGAAWLVAGLVAYGGWLLGLL